MSRLLCIGLNTNQGFPLFCDVTENGREPPPLGDILNSKIENLAKRLNKRGLTFKYSMGLFARSVNPFRFKEHRHIDLDLVRFQI